MDVIIHHSSAHANFDPPPAPVRELSLLPPVVSELRLHLAAAGPDPSSRSAQQLEPWAKADLIAAVSALMDRYGATVVADVAETLRTDRRIAGVK